MSSMKIADNLYWVGALDPELRVFDVVMKTEYGTSYNSYLLQTEKHNILFETVKDKFFDNFIENIQEICPPEKIDYIILNHTEPDHSGSLEKLIKIAPDAEILASSTALSFLKNITNSKLKSIPLVDNQKIQIDDAVLRFLSVPFLHWPDSIYTYIENKKILLTCDSFGCHYADEKICNDLIKGDFTKAYRYYFEMIMGPFKKHVRYALNKIKKLDINMICPGHGPVLRKNLEHYIELYEKWSLEKEKPENDRAKVTLAYVSAYGYTKELAETISDAVRETLLADIKIYDMLSENKNAVLNEMRSSDGILFGSPTINGEALPPVLDLANELNGINDYGKVAGAFGSYGWSGEAVDALMNRLRQIRMKCVDPGFKVNFKPSVQDLKNARKYGLKFAGKLKEEWIMMKNEKNGKTFWKCTVCGEVFEGGMPPEVCPVCGAGQEAFVEYVPEDVTFEDKKKIKLIIIGSGAGAVAAAEAFRERNDNAEIDIYTKESIAPYYRPVLTKAIAQNIAESAYFLHNESFYKDKNININYNSEVTEIIRDEKKIKLQNGKFRKYDKLLLAAGARCFIPPIKGIELPQVVSLREQKDFDELEKLCENKKKRIVILGGGLLGLETASELLELGHTVSVLEAIPGIIPKQMDKEGSPILEKIISQSNVNIKLGTMIQEIAGETKVAGVRCSDNETIPADIVILSAGIKSNIKLAEKCGLELDLAVKVDKTMKTSDPDIYAVGDCCICGEKFHGLWEPALEHGKVAGANIAGEKKEYKNKIFGATLHAFGTSMFSIGKINFDEKEDFYQISAKDEINESYKKLYFQNNNLVGGILLGDVKLTNKLIAGVNNSWSVEDAADSKLL